MSNRRLLAVMVAVGCLLGLAVGGTLLADTDSEDDLAALIEELDGDADRLGSDTDPVGYGGEPSERTSDDDLRTRYGAVIEPYWRTAVYDQYTGTSWERTEPSAEYEPTGLAGSTETMRIEPHGIETVLPGATQPAEIDGLDDGELHAYGDGTVEGASEHDPGEKFFVERPTPDWRYDDLETATGAPPDDVTQRYTELPDGEMSQLADRTADIVERADTPYEKAVLIERWLLVNKEYEGSAGATSDDVASEFVFDRSAGNEELFATSMVAMLRTQDVPARYAIGFAPGEQREDGTEIIRGTAAHAWVEVYIPETGWVQFDPTPPDRIPARADDTRQFESFDFETDQFDASAQQISSSPNALDASVDSDASQSVEHETVDVVVPNQKGTAHATLASAEDGWQPAEPTPSVEFLSEPIPGSTVTLELTRNGSRVADHRVSFNGETIGVTDAAGRVTGEVPFTSELVVLVEEPVGDEPLEEIDGEDENDGTEDEQDSGDGDEQDGEDGGEQDGEDEGEQDGEDADETDGTGAGAGGLGALTPGETTDVGGGFEFDPGTFGTTDTAVHFEVESPMSTYWRTGSFDRYTGDGWERTGGTEPYEEPIDHDGVAGETFQYRLTLERPGTALPTAWRPRTVGGVDDLVVTADRGLRAADGVDAGTTVVATSEKPVRDVERLRSADDDPPAEIMDRYTGMPEDTPERFESFGAELTANSETPYDAAVAVQDWLRSEKEYSLDASTESDHLADEFVFEMKAGYCEQFATAMVGLLRSQDIPARYTVGYTSGQQVDEETYRVRGMNAHAWVEVYLDGVGWIRFDPTPGDERLANQQDALSRDDPDGTYEPTEAGSPGEQFEPGTVEELPAFDSRPIDLGDSPDHVTVSDTVAIGNGSESVSSQVRFVASPADSTDAVETVEPTAEIPPVVELNDADEGEDVNANGANGREETTYWIEPEREQFASGIRDSRAETVVDSEQSGTSAPEGELNFSLETTIDVEAGETKTPGERLDVLATIRGTPVPNATVVVETPAGERVGGGQTDSDGQASVTVPFSSAAVISVERGETYGETRHDIVTETALTIDDEPVPGESVQTSVEVGGQPVTGMTVEAIGEGGERTTTVTDGGEATLELPYAERIVVTAGDGEFSDSEIVRIETALELLDDPATISEPRVELTANGQPVENVTVSPGSERTDEHGQATVEVPPVGRTVLVAERDSVRVTERVELDEELTVSTSGLPLPGQSVEVEVIAGGEPVAGAAVGLDGAFIDETDESGTLVVDIPRQPQTSAELVVVANGVEAETTVRPVVGWAAVGIGVVVLGAGFGATWRWLGLRNWVPTVASGVLTRAIHAAKRVQPRLSAVRGTLRGFILDTQQTLRNGTSWLRSGIATIASMPRVLARRLLGKSASDRETPNGKGTDSTESDGAVLRAWRRLVTVVQPAPTETPAEIARRAVAAGLPKRPVRTIMRAYRARRYGNDTGDETTRAVEQAKGELEEKQ